MAKIMKIVDLFRIKIFPSPLFGEGKVDSHLIANVVDQAFATQAARAVNRVSWRMGKPDVDSASSLCFNFGKSSIHQSGMFDEQKQDFVDQKKPDATYTRVYVDAKYSVVGIVRNSRLGRNSRNLAATLAEFLLNNGGKDSISNIIIRPISDPTTLLAVVSNAHAVTTVGFDSTPPNPWDNKDFPKEFGGYIKRAKAEKGKVSVSGKDLDKSTIRETIRLQLRLATWPMSACASTRTGELSRKSLKTLRMWWWKRAPPLSACAPNFAKNTLR